MTGIPGNFVARIPGGGGTPPRGARLANGALIAKAGGNPLAVRTGVLADGGGPVVTGTTGMSYRVRAFSGAVGQTSTLTNGPTVTPNDGEVIVSTDPAPGANSRIDVIYIWQRLLSGDGGSESTNQPIIAVRVGDVSATPVAKSIPDGAVELARAMVTAGTQATSGLTITQGQVTWANSGQMYSDPTVPTVGGQATGPGGAPIIRKIHYHEESTNSTGAIVRTFPTAFPNGILHVSATTISGAGINPVVDAGIISKSSVRLVWPGVVNTLVKFSFEAVGW